MYIPQPFFKESQTFIRAVCETPYDDTPRLAYADWLTERADESPEEWRATMRDKAELIKVQIRLARTKAPPRPSPILSSLNVMFGGDPRKIEAAKEAWDRYQKDRKFEIAALQKGSLCSILRGGSRPSEWTVMAGGVSCWSRGFPHRVNTPALNFEFWVRAGPSIVVNWPITSMEFGHRSHPLDGNTWRVATKDEERPRYGHRYSGRRREITEDEMMACRMPIEVFRELPGWEPHVNWMMFVPGNPYNQTAWTAATLATINCARRAAGLSVFPPNTILNWVVSE